MTIYCIYQFTNNVNGKRYIGQTKTVTNRIRQHKQSAYNPTTPFGVAISEFGWKSFSFEILKESLSKEQADQIEQEYIRDKRSHISEWGYNVVSKYHNQSYINQIDYLRQKQQILFDELLLEYMQDNI